MGTDDLSEAIAGSKRVFDESKRTSAVIVTSCDANCMESLLEPWLWGLRSVDAYDQHAIVVANGLAALKPCQELQTRYGHTCLLDKMCIKDGVEVAHAAQAGQFNFKAQGYTMALMQKLVWAQVILQHGVSVLWLDMDVLLLRDPLPMMLSYTGADFMVAGERCEPRYKMDADAELHQHGKPFHQNGETGGMHDASPIYQYHG